MGMGSRNATINIQIGTSDAPFTDEMALDELERIVEILLDETYVVSYGIEAGD